MKPLKQGIDFMYMTLPLNTSAERRKEQFLPLTLNLCWFLLFKCKLRCNFREERFHGNEAFFFCGYYNHRTSAKSCGLIREECWGSGQVAGRQLQCFLNASLYLFLDLLLLLCGLFQLGLQVTDLAQVPGRLVQRHTHTHNLAGKLYIYVYVRQRICKCQGLCQISVHDIDK